MAARTVICHTSSERYAAVQRAVTAIAQDPGRETVYTAALDITWALLDEASAESDIDTLERSATLLTATATQLAAGLKRPSTWDTRGLVKMAALGAWCLHEAVAVERGRFDLADEVDETEALLARLETPRHLALEAGAGERVSNIPVVAKWKTARDR